MFALKYAHLKDSFMALLPFTNLMVFSHPFPIQTSKVEEASEKGSSYVAQVGFELTIQPG